MGPRKASLSVPKVMFDVLVCISEMAKNVIFSRIS